MGIVRNKAGILDWLIPSASFVWYLLFNTITVRRWLHNENSIPNILANLPTPSRMENQVILTQNAETTIAVLANLVPLLYIKLWKRRCLLASLLIMDWARRKGLNPKLNIALKNLNNKSTGHCWLSLSGVMFCERYDSDKQYPVIIARQDAIVYRAG